MPENRGLGGNYYEAAPGSHGPRGPHDGVRRRRQEAGDGPLVDQRVDPLDVLDGHPVVIRSTWNYYANVDAFLAWVDRTPNLRNRAQVVRWSAVKTYLRDLEERGVATVPTVFVEKGEKKDLASLPWDEIVVKPLVSA